MNEQTKPEVSTEWFEIHHGRRPGSIGGWTFYCPHAAVPDSVRHFFGTFQRAKREAQEAFRGTPKVYVLP